MADETGFMAPACLECGACCFGEMARYVPVSGADWSRLGADADRWAWFDNQRVFMRMEGGHCAALRIERGAQARYVCAIYEQRPQVCRDLGRGSSACEAEWLRKRPVAVAAATTPRV